MGSPHDREVVCSASDTQGSNSESCVWRQCHSIHLHNGGLKPHSFHFIFIILTIIDITEEIHILKYISMWYKTYLCSNFINKYIFYIWSLKIVLRCPSLNKLPPSYDVTLFYKHNETLFRKKIQTLTHYMQMWFNQY